MIAGRPVFGFHILKSLPVLEGIAMPPQEFEEGSAKFLYHDFFPKIVSTFTCDSRVYRAWKDWIEEFAPKTDSVVEYIENHPYPQPLLDVLKGESRTTMWSNSLPRTITANLGFVWPEITAFCNPSVVTEFTPAPPDARTFVNSNPEDQALLVQFRTGAQVYYDHTLPALTVPVLQGVLKRRVDRSGRGIPSTGTKPQLLERIKTFDEAFISLLHRYLCADNLSVVVNILSDSDRAEAEVCKLDGQVVKRRDIWSFRPGQCLSVEGMDACMSLLRGRDKQITEVHAEVNGTYRYYSPMRANVFMSQKQIDIILQRGQWPPNDKLLQEDAVDRIQAVYMPIHLNEYWILLIVEVAQTRFLVFDIDNRASGEVITGVMSKVSSIFQFCTDWAWEYQTMRLDSHMIDPSLSGVAVLASVEYFIHSVPFIVTHDLIDRIGKMFCYCLCQKEELPIQAT
jgi:hypothetical protein